MNYSITSVPTPIGTLHIAFSSQGVVRLSLPPLNYEQFIAELPPGTACEPAGSQPLATELQQQLQRYFNGQLRQFELPLALQGSSFQLAAWRELMKVPYGTTVSYGELARRTERQKSARAIGAAMGANPIAIIVPCHRVLRADGSLGGFGGGLEMKRFLLELEGCKI